MSECESSAIATVISRNIFNAVEKEKAGAMAGQSDMVVQLKLTNSATGAVVREKTLSTANNPYGAAWTFGSSDRTLPADMGKIIGEYLAAIAPAK